MTEYNQHLSHYKWTVSSEADVRRIEQKCQQIGYILSPHQQIVQLFCEHGLQLPYKIVIKFYMSNDSFKYYYCIYRYSIQWHASHDNWCYARRIYRISSLNT
jgi:hypothetical protein